MNNNINIINRVYKLILDDVYRSMKKFQYGYLNMERNQNFEHYHTTPYKKFKTSMLGVCWDCVNYEAIELKKYGFQITTDALKQSGDFSAYYIVAKDLANEPTHTFVIVKIGDKYFWLEKAWKDFEGIHEFSSEQSALNTIKQHAHQKDLHGKITAYKYIPKDVVFNVAEFMNYIEGKGVKID